MNNLIKTVTYIVDRSTELKNKFTNEISAPVEFACIFCQNEKEYKRFASLIEKLGKIAEKAQSGFTYFLNNHIKTASGNLRLVKIRKPDFNTNYIRFKEKYQHNSKFELVKRETFEMLRLSDPNFDVLVCFSNIPKGKDLGIKL